MTTKTSTLIEYEVWQRSVRIFHWLNVLCIIGLIAIGTVILNHKILGISTDGKILLKTWHVYFGYVFVINLTWRLVFGFIGNRYATWTAILPIGSQYKQALKYFIAAHREKKPIYFLGHNPIARIMVIFLFSLLTTQAISGLVLAGTDVYMPPFGHTITKWISEDKNKLDKIKPYSKENVNEKKYAEMRAFRKPFINTHYYVFYTLLAAIVLHIAGVIYFEIKERNGLISAMFTGKKTLAEKPIDFD